MAWLESRQPFRACLGPGWWAHLVGALQVHPHKHYANYPPQTDRKKRFRSGV